MTSPTNQAIPFPVQCKVEEIDGTLHLTGTFNVRYDIAPSAGQLDAIIELADHIGRLVGVEVYHFT
jgi:hypothetical protein